MIAREKKKNSKYRLISDGWAFSFHARLHLPLFFFSIWNLIKDWFSCVSEGWCQDLPCFLLFWRLGNGGGTTWECMRVRERKALCVSEPQSKWGDNFISFLPNNLPHGFLISRSVSVISVLHWKMDRLFMSRDVFLAWWRDCDIFIMQNKYEYNAKFQIMQTIKTLLNSNGHIAIHLSLTVLTLTS